MNKLALFGLLLLVGCASTPVIDSRGGSGNIEHDPKRQHDDYFTCKEIAEDETNDFIEVSKKGYNWIVRPKLLWLSPKMVDTKKEIIENCMEGRGFQILTWK